MIRIGLVGENPNDTFSIKNLLLKKYKQIQFDPITKKVRGTHLNNIRKLGDIIESELTDTDFRDIIFVTDLDGLESHKERVKQKEEWFKELNRKVRGKGIFLLNIYQLEALILSDISNFNKFFGTKIKFTGDPMKQNRPKEHLKKMTSNHRRKYKESDCPEIFARLDINVLVKNCRYFSTFLTEFDVRIKEAV
jgi:hypothetical protein